MEKKIDNQTNTEGAIQATEGENNIPTGAEGQTSDSNQTKESACAWVDKCGYKCKVDSCDFNSNSHQSFGYHIKKVHKLQNFKEYAEKYGPAITQRTYHTCVLCDAEVLHNRSGIEGHLNQKHKYLTIKSYYNWYIQHILNPSPNELKNPGNIEFLGHIMEDVCPLKNFIPPLYKGQDLLPLKTLPAHV